MTGTNLFRGRSLIFEKSRSKKQPYVNKNFQFIPIDETVANRKRMKQKQTKLKDREFVCYQGLNSCIVWVTGSKSSG